MIIGAQKSGTTSLAFQLAQHPQICLCARKEPAYFNRTERWREGLAEYHALYAPRPGQLCGEASTMYTFLPEWLGTHERLHAYNPALRFVYIMREPLERIRSHYAFRQVRNRVDEPADQVVLTDPMYVNRSRYAVQIQPYIETFGRDRVLLLVFEEYVADPHGTLREVARFLDIDVGAVDAIDVTAKGATLGEPVLGDRARAVRRAIVRSGLRSLVPRPLVTLARRRMSRKLERKPDLSPAVQDALRRLLAADVEAIERLLGRSIPAWHR